MELDSRVAGLCANCGSQLAGEYCHVCGQKKIEADWQSVPRFLRVFADELVHFDFKTVRSLVALLFRPGELPAEFLAGRRRQYLGPLKLYFLCAAIFFFVGPLVSGFNLEDLLRHDRDGVLRTMVDVQIARKQMDFDLFAERFNMRVQTVYTLGISVSVIASALVLKLLFRRTAPALATHLVFALYYVSFFYLAALLLGAIDKAVGGMDTPVSLGITYCILLPYAFLALRRVYQESTARIAWKTVVVLLAGLIVDSPVNFAAMFLTFALI